MKKGLIAVALLLLTASAQAYIGPGAGISVLGSIFSVIAGILLALLAIILWPVRRMLKRRKNKGEAPGASEGTNDA